MEIQLSDIYNIRPDIFVKGAEDRLHIQHGGKNFILRLQRELIDSLYQCLGRMDGMRCVGDILDSLPEGHRAPVLKFVGFLVEKRAAFHVADPGDEQALAPVEETLGYLRLYADHSAATFRHFVQARILIAAGGYALASAIKTLARLGIRDLHVVNTELAGNGAWIDTDLRACFDELRRWPDATLTILPSTQSVLPAFDHILHITDHNNDGEMHRHVAEACADAEQLVAAYTERHVCLMRHDDYLKADPARFASGCVEPGKLIAGAVTTLFFFDHLCNIRRLRPGRYHYYSLLGESTLRFAGLDQLLPVDAILPAKAPSPPAAGVPLDTLLAQPLFPLQAMVEHTDPSSYIKLYALHFAAQNGSGTLVAAGHDKQQCQASLLSQLVTQHGLWFAQSDAAELDSVRRLRARQAHAEQVVLALRDLDVAHEAPLFPDLTAPEQYIAFCINAGFGERVQWRQAATGDPALSMCALLYAGDVRLFIPHDGTLAIEERQAGLLALYAALWNRRIGGGKANDVIVAPGALLPRTEADEA